jgi:predicted PurR-regulated permease PerM
MTRKSPIAKLLLLCLFVFALFLVFLLGKYLGKSSNIKPQTTSYKDSVIQEQHEQIQSLQTALIKSNAQHREHVQKVATLQQEYQKAQTIKKDNIELRKTLTKVIASRGGTRVRELPPAEVKPIDDYQFTKYAGKFTLSYYTPSADECGNDKGITA